MFQNLIERRAPGNGGLLIFLLGLATLILGLIAINQATLATVSGWACSLCWRFWPSRTWPRCSSYSFCIPTQL